MMDVTDVLRDRMHEPAGLQRMVSLSIAAHVAVFAALFFAPSGWLGRSSEPETVMTITLGGWSGPSNGGMTAMAARPIQAVTPPEVKRPEIKRPEPPRPPVEKTPEMTMPVPKPAKVTPVKAAPAEKVHEAPQESRGNTPTRGAEAAPGNAVADTGARGQGFGLSSGGGPGAGSTLDVANFCCPDYLVVMTERVKSAWSQNQGVAGQSVIKFTIQRDGRISDAIIEKSSGYPGLDLTALRAILVAKQLPPLPSAFPNPTLTVHLNFAYQQ
jgi:TonB family protein